MQIKIDYKISDEVFEEIKSSTDAEITIDLVDAKYLSSRTITRLLVLQKFNKKIILINTNTHIKETIHVLNLNDVIEIKN